MLRPRRSCSVPARGPRVELVLLLVLIRESLGADAINYNSQRPHERQMGTSPAPSHRHRLRSPRVHEARIGSVAVPSEVYGFLGANVMLPCHLQPLVRDMHVTQVVWYRGTALDRSTVATIYNGRISVMDPERMEFVATELLNASLLLKSLQLQDENTYHCEFITYPHGSHSDLKASTTLHVLVKPQDQVEALEVGGPPPLEPVPAARCVSTRGRPPANISWSLPLNWKVNTSQEPGPLPGTTTVSSVLLVVPSSEVDGRNVTCVVDHQGFQAPHLLPVTLSVRYAPNVSISGYDDNWYVGRTEVALNCNVRSKPEPTSYEWSMTGGPLPSFVVPQGHRLFVPAVNESVNTTIFCHATNAIGTGYAELTILVRDRCRERSDPHIIPYVIIGVVLVVIAFVLVIACFLKKNVRSQSRRVSWTVRGGAEDLPQNGSAQ